MRVTFVGVGEAFDENLDNTCLLVETSGSSILLDCGFTAAHAFWRTAREPLELDVLYITHFHGDHYFGIPALLVRSVEEGRTKPLTIMGQPGVEDRVLRLMEMAYSSTLSRAQFEIAFIECAASESVTLHDTRFRFADNDHPTPCLAIRLDSEGASLFYSGDGRPTDATRALAAGCTMVAHESFSLEPFTAGHGTVDSSLEFARQAGAEHLALVHIKRTVRRSHFSQILDKVSAEQALRVHIPEPGDIITL